MEIPMSPRMKVIHVILDVAVAVALYSAYVLDRAIVHCFFEDQERCSLILETHCIFFLFLHHLSNLHHIKA